MDKQPDKNGHQNAGNENQNKKDDSLARIVMDDGTVYVRQKPIYKQIMFWICVVLAVSLFFITSAALISKFASKKDPSQKPIASESETKNKNKDSDKDSKGKDKGKDDKELEEKEEKKSDEDKDKKDEKHSDDFEKTDDDSENTSDDEAVIEDSSGEKIYTTADHELAPGETWEVPGQWKLTINSVKPTEDRNQFSDKTPTEVFIVNYTYENLGYTSDIQDLFIMPENIIDGTGVMGYTYPASTAADPQPTPVGATCAGAEAAFGVDNYSDVVKIRFSIYDNNLKKQQVVYSCPTRQ